VILVTGAGGKTGRAVLRALAARRVRARALVHRPEHGDAVRAAGAVDVIAGDLRDPGLLTLASKDVGAVYHICPNVHPDEVKIGRAVIEAARAAGVGRFAYHSVLHPQVEAMPHHWRKLRVEEMLLASGLGTTILQPALYMQNVLGQWASILERGVYTVPYPASTPLCMVDLEDVAAVAAAVLTDDGHAGATYELVGPEALTPEGVAEILGRRLNRTVEVEEIGLDGWAERARASGMRDDAIDTLVAMFRHYGRHGFQGSPRVLTMLLGRPPTTFDAFVMRVLAGGA
jgi:NAD(P)H dehydrogenase (quinone)